MFRELYSFSWNKRKLFDIESRHFICLKIIVYIIVAKEDVFPLIAFANYPFEYRDYF